MNPNTPDPQSEVIEKILGDIIEAYGSDRKYPNAITGKAKSQLLKLISEARIDELKNLALAHWQKSIPEQAVLDRLSELSRELKL